MHTVRLTHRQPAHTTTYPTGESATDALIAPSVTRRLIQEFAARPAKGPARHEINAITERERETLILVARGLSNHEIAAQLFISTATVKAHISRLLDKLDVRDRARRAVG